MPVDGGKRKEKEEESGQEDVAAAAAADEEADAAAEAEIFDLQRPLWLLVEITAHDSAAPPPAPPPAKDRTGSGTLFVSLACPSVFPLPRHRLPSGRRIGGRHHAIQARRADHHR
ncbi:hypothetical protein MGYG_03957 [Nannizzia gypsea CBS 118893]|uniref:Uncharacterized protein n=1 Tax=Arthroderma gypseum (strain ATCC MYA-4604 / CBS 118893) TaxID=535722 RepID=E4UUI8_ARTGP|nr:hypothetical protein MGYG_03957 [Nannizzia gypsea CBS 118893]EFR00955.1 hypothetical protein MGYG_03957 [Nannizzia gypsea CBS 118893]